MADDDALVRAVERRIGATIPHRTVERMQSMPCATGQSSHGHPSRPSRRKSPTSPSPHRPTRARPQQRDGHPVPEDGGIPRAHRRRSRRVGEHPTTTEHRI
jgi:hypothetical protein